MTQEWVLVLKTPPGIEYQVYEFPVPASKNIRFFIKKGVKYVSEFKKFVPLILAVKTVASVF